MTWRMVRQEKREPKSWRKPYQKTITIKVFLQLGRKPCPALLSQAGEAGLLSLNISRNDPTQNDMK